MDAAEFAEWRAFYRLEPWGTMPHDWRMGLLAATIANSQRHPDTPPYHPDDFLPQWVPDERTDEDEDASILATQALFEGLTQSMGGTIHNGTV